MGQSRLSTEIFSPAHYKVLEINLLNLELFAFSREKGEKKLKAKYFIYFKEEILLIKKLYDLLREQNMILKNCFRVYKHMKIKKKK